jgi:hypothetical protein
VTFRPKPILWRSGPTQSCDVQAQALPNPVTFRHYPILWRSGTTQPRPDCFCQIHGPTCPKPEITSSISKCISCSSLSVTRSLHTARSACVLLMALWVCEYPLHPSKHTKTDMKMARQNLFPVRRLKRFGMGPQILKKFYSGTIESILTACITARHLTVRRYRG